MSNIYQSPGLRPLPAVGVAVEAYDGIADEWYPMTYTELPDEDRVKCNPYTGEWYLNGYLCEACSDELTKSYQGVWSVEGEFYLCDYHAFGDPANARLWRLPVS